MKKPTLAALMEKNENITKYSLVVGIAKRAREIQSNAEETGDRLIDRPVMLATNDVINGKVKIVEGAN